MSLGAKFVIGFQCVLTALLAMKLEVSAQDAQAGLTIWTKIYEVLSHPRCANCHVADEHPRWSDAISGASRIHPMNVTRGPKGYGNVEMPCGSCHQAKNGAMRHAPPGAPDWHLAPAEMAWFGKTSAEVCEQIKDRIRNGNWPIQKVAEHVRKERLVLWAWSPGPGRDSPPGSAEETSQLFESWHSAGKPCPTS